MFTDETRAGPTEVPSPPDSFRAELEPEVVLPSQLSAGVRDDASLRPEKRLMLAVLEEAVADFQKHVVATSRQGERLFREAADWFADDDRSWPFAFESICEALGLEPSWVRQGLARWADVQRARHARGETVVRQQLRRIAGYRSKATGRAVVGRPRSRW
jgi:hypothetical protein